MKTVCDVAYNTVQCTCYRNPHRAEPLGLRRKTSSFHVNFLNNSSIFSIRQLIEKDKQKNVHQRLISKILNNWKIGLKKFKENQLFLHQTGQQFLATGCSIQVCFLLDLISSGANLITKEKRIS